MMHASDNRAVPDEMSGRREPWETLERKFLEFAESHRQHYLALADLQAKIGESLRVLNAERTALFEGLRARAEALDDASREIVAPREERDR
jgi:hypothetical protein